MYGEENRKLPGMSAPEEIAVLCVDDNPDEARLHKAILDLEPDLCCAGLVHDIQELPGTVRRLRPQVVLLDLVMPGGDALAAMEALRAQQPATAVLVLSGYLEPKKVQRVLDGGARGFVSKGVDPERLLAAVRRAASGEYVGLVK